MCGISQKDKTIHTFSNRLTICTARTNRNTLANFIKRMYLAIFNALADFNNCADSAPLASEASVRSTTAITSNSYGILDIMSTKNQVVK